MPPKDVKKKSMRYNNCVKLSVSFLLKFLSSSLSSLWAWYICPRYVRVPMTSGSIWWTDLKFSITPDRCHVSRGVFEMLTFLPFEGYYSFFLNDWNRSFRFKSAKSVIRIWEKTISKKTYPLNNCSMATFFILIVTPDFHR